MALNTSALDAHIAGAITALVAARNRLVPPNDRAAESAAGLIARLAKLLAQPDARQRCLEAAALPEYSPTWRGYDDASPNMQELMDEFNLVVSPLRRAAATLLGHKNAASYLAAHPHDPEVWAAVEAGDDPRPVINRVLLRRAERPPQRFGARELSFPGGRSTSIVVDGHLSYGPAAPEILATAGRQQGGDGPRFLLQRGPISGARIAVDLDALRVTTFQRPNVATHVPDIQSIDEEGVVVALRNGETRRWAWDDFVWQPLRRFET
jgi:hypothetical protein